MWWGAVCRERAGGGAADSLERWDMRDFDTASDKGQQRRQQAEPTAVATSSSDVERAIGEKVCVRAAKSAEGLQTSSRARLLDRASIEALLPCRRAGRENFVLSCLDACRG